jgi:hypothetical protein
MRYTIRPLGASTWAAFAELVERNNGIFGGCWCMGYHPEDSRTDAAHNRAGKTSQELKCQAATSDWGIFSSCGQAVASS